MSAFPKVVKHESYAGLEQAPWTFPAFSKASCFLGLRALGIQAQVLSVPAWIESTQRLGCEGLPMLTVGSIGTQQNLFVRKNCLCDTNIYTYIYIYIHTHTSIHTCAYTCICIYIYIYIFTHSDTHTHKSKQNAHINTKNTECAALQM